MSRTEGGSTSPGAALGALHAGGLTALLVTQPTLDLVARHPAFLDVHRLGGLGIVALAVLSTLVPAVLAAPLGLWLARRPQPAPVRIWLTLLSVSLLVVPTLFLLQPGVRSRLAAPETAAGVAVASPVPIVILVLDELPLQILFDKSGGMGSGGIEAARFPAFARLAATSHGFYGARSPYATTLPAVPALVTGRYAGDDLVVPDADECNLFTDLAATYALDVEERVTRLARGIRRPGLVRAPVSSASVIARDLVVLYLHRMLPAAWTGGLPEVDGAWGAFGRGAAQSDSAADPRVADFEGFLERLRAPGEVPELWFFHADLPHQPWTLGEPQGTLEGQTRVVDGLLGDLLDRMDRLGLLEPSLLIVVADHGIGLSAGAGERGDPDRRVVFDEILRVPLFLKLPGQTDGVRHEGYVETVDVVPTLARVLGYEPACPPDGRSLFGPPRRWQETTFFLHRGWDVSPWDGLVKETWPD